ncbi:hypothetical protein GGS26DRAFT_308227 [Hypomontagnella submonticulosa]|nr:hypothetical protein GGS26DRAFT_308227 [Hypomontagnella submonticulosa]
MSVPRGCLSCDCWTATINIISQAEAPFRPLSPSSARQLAPNMPLSDVLSLGRNLVQHWELLNGCPSSEAHLSQPVFRFMADAIGRALTLHEMAIGGILKRQASETRDSRELSPWRVFNNHNGAHLPHDTPTSRPSSERRSLCKLQPTLIGSLELDDEEEIVIVHREALRHSVTRLGAILQDIEEELRQEGRNEVSEAEHPLQDKEVKELMGRLFRLLGRIAT